MESQHSESRTLTEPSQTRAPDVAKIVVAGGFGVGKTTFIGSVSDIQPLTTEALMTAAARAVDNFEGVDSRKETTTVAMDFGRVELASDLWLYLFGTPGQERFSFMWDDLSRGAIGAVILADSNRLEHSFAALDFYERRQVPFVVAINCFDGIAHHSLDSIRLAMNVGPDVPILYTDAREKSATKHVLSTLVRLAISHVGDNREYA